MTSPRREPAWRMVRLGEILAEGPTNGWSPKSDADANGTWSLRLSATTSGRLEISPRTTRRLDERLPPDSKYWLRAGDLLVQRSNTSELVGVAALFDGPSDAYVYPDTIMRLRMQPQADARWVWRCLNSPVIRKRVRNLAAGTAGNMPKINGEKLRALEVPLPPLPEQRRIADILDKADAVRRKRAEAIGLVDDLTKAVFLEMFGDPVTNPTGWPVVTLGSQLEELRYGTSEKCSESRRPGEIGVLRIPNVVGELISLDDLKFAALDEAEVDRLKLVNDDLLFVRSNGNPEYIARCAVVDEPAVGYAFASYLIRARFKRDSTLRAPFARDVVSFPTYRRHLVQQARTTAGNYNINTQGLSSLRLIVPPLTLQDEYVASHKALAGLHRKEVAGQGEAESLFDSLVHRAFRGEL
ncbi:MAG: hypothetical protein AMXMBFR58_36590 [Phycisphaerae bacterium]